MSQVEFLESPEEFRYTAEPVIFHDIYEHYNKAKNAFWVPEEIDEDLNKDKKNWDKIDPAVKKYLKYIVAFFAISDGVVGEVLADEVQSRIMIREAKIWLNFQTMMEDIHSIVYSKLVNVYVDNSTERRQIFNAIANFPSIKRQISWLHKWVGKENPMRHLSMDNTELIRKITKLFQVNMENYLGFLDYEVELVEPNAPIPQFERFVEHVFEDKKPLAQIVAAMAFMEIVNFSGKFLAIFWFNQQYPGILPGLALSNQFISRDETGHGEFWIMLYRKYIKNPMKFEDIKIMLDECVRAECEFINDSLPEKLPGMNAELAQDYIKFVADSVMIDLGYNTVYNKENPFPFMQKQSIAVRSNDFFTGQTSDYAIARKDELNFDESDDDF